METPQPYTLSDGERAAMQSLNVACVNAKVKLHDLRQQQEAGEKELTTAVANFQGALALLGSAHGMALVSLTPDFSQLVSGGSQ